MLCRFENIVHRCLTHRNSSDIAIESITRHSTHIASPEPPANLRTSIIAFFVALVGTALALPAPPAPVGKSFSRDQCFVLGFIANKTADSGEMDAVTA